MRVKNGYKSQKHQYRTGKWLKWYFAKRANRRGEKPSKQFAQKMSDNIQDLEPEFSKTVDDFFWDLI